MATTVRSRSGWPNSRPPLTAELYDEVAGRRFAWLLDAVLDYVRATSDWISGDEVHAAIHTGATGFPRSSGLLAALCVDNWIGLGVFERSHGFVRYRTFLPTASDEDASEEELSDSVSYSVIDDEVHALDY